MKNVLIVDLGLGNIGSVAAALCRLDLLFQTLSRPPGLSNTFTHIILPGVGSFAEGSSLLDDSWRSYLTQTRESTPLLGICLGMQLLATCGTESSRVGSSAPGLNLIPGTVEKIPDDHGLHLPHMGWNSVEHNHTSPLLSNIDSGSDFYFVHSYCYKCDLGIHSVASTTYGHKFPTVISNPQLLVYGVQFHPEKSQRNGRLLMENFFSL